MLLNLLAIPLFLDSALAIPLEIDVEKRQDCPSIHIFGARGTTEPAGYGASSTVVNSVLQAYPGSTAEAISYPACGGQSSCGGDSYSTSVAQGIQAVAAAVNSFHSQCPQTKIVLAGYSQGGEIMDAALCGGGDPNQGYTNTAVPLTSSAVNQVKAAIFMGDPLFTAGLPYDVGTCSAGGFDKRPNGFNCPSANKIQSYCDAGDPYCCNGNDAATHGSYGEKYGAQALTFIENKLSTS